MVVRFASGAFVVVVGFSVFILCTQLENIFHFRFIQKWIHAHMHIKPFVLFLLSVFFFYIKYPAFNSGHHCTNTDFTYLCLYFSLHVTQILFLFFFFSFLLNIMIHFMCFWTWLTEISTAFFIVSVVLLQGTMRKKRREIKAKNLR